MLGNEGGVQSFCSTSLGGKGERLEVPRVHGDGKYYSHQSRESHTEGLINGGSRGETSEPTKKRIRLKEGGKVRAKGKKRHLNVLDVNKVLREQGLGDSKDLQRHWRGGGGGGIRAF